MTFPRLLCFPRTHGWFLGNPNERFGDHGGSHSVVLMGFDNVAGSTVGTGPYLKEDISKSREQFSCSGGSGMAGAA